MSNHQKITKMIVIPLICCAFLIQGTQAYARGGEGGGFRGGGGGFHGGGFHGGGFHGGWGGPRWGWGGWGWGGWGWALPLTATALIIAGTTYYYDEGVYYQRMDNGYVVVPAPAGSVVTTIPVAYQPMIVNGVSYYTINGATYMSTPNGYQVVVPPVVQAPQPVIIQAAPQPAITIVPTATQAQQAPQNVTPVPQAPQNAVIENTTQGGSPGNTQDQYTVNISNSKGTYTPVILKRSGTGFIGPQGEYYAEFPSIDQLKAMYAK